MSEFIHEVDVKNSKPAWPIDNVKVLLHSTVLLYESNINSVPDSIKDSKYFQNDLKKARSIVENFDLVSISSNSIKQKINKKTDVEKSGVLEGSD